jgi:hypothetical protein
MTSSRPAAWVVALSMFAAAPAAANCPRTDLPAATLLFPYFEVDLAGSRTTLISIGATPTLPTGMPSVLARVTLWTNWALPTLSFDIFLRQGAVQTINLADVLTTGRVPITEPPAGRYQGCNSALGGFVGPPAPLRAKHTGAAVGELCYSRRGEDDLATGYVTVDVVNRCAATTVNPSVREYFQGSSPVASMANVLWGDFTLVDPAHERGVAHNAVHIVADPFGLTAGRQTFYGRYVGTSAADRRAPLSRAWVARYAIGDPFDSTELIVWRDTRARIAAPARCGNRPPWAPLPQQLVRGRNEAGNTSAPQLLPQQVFPYATQIVEVTSWDGAVEAGYPNRIVPTAPFGTLQLDFGFDEGIAYQGWVGSRTRANRVGVGLAATPTVDGCPNPL